MPSSPEDVEALGGNPADPARGERIGRVLSMWRYPVKSLRGERLESLAFDGRGAVGDRRYAIGTADGKIGSGKDSRRFRRTDGLFSLGSRLVAGVPWIAFPGGREVPGTDPGLDAALGEALGVDVRLIEELPTDDAEHVEHHDMAPVHLITTGSLGWLADRLGVESIDPRRFRPNLVLEVEGRDPVEFNWAGHLLSLGPDLSLEILGATERCRMVGLPQGDLPGDRRLLANLARASEAHFGVYARVRTAGVVRPGDPVRRVR